MGELAAGEERKRSIKLFCPSVAKSFQIFEGENRRLDLGSIARAFGLDPNTLKLNGHFVSRGVDFVASSVTWKSLIGFFSARGLSTGDSDALLVHGKQLSTDTKRAHDRVDSGNGILATDRQQVHATASKRPQLECTKRLKMSGPADSSWCNGPNPSGLKRKLWIEDDSHLKRSRTCEAFLSKLHILRFSYFSPYMVSKNAKRMRDEDDVATTPFKKIR